MSPAIDLAIRKEPPPGWPWCHKCDKPADQVTKSHNPVTNQTDYAITCHGTTTTVTITDYEAMTGTHKELQLQEEPAA